MHEVTTPVVQSKLSPQSNARMSSVEIAELMEKRHDHVMRDIQNLIDQDAISLPNFGESTYKNDRGKEYPMYLLDFQATMVLITGYDAKKRALIIDRWLKLERGEVAPTGMMLVDKNYFESLLKNSGLLEENSKLLKKLLENAENKPAKRVNFTPEEDAKVLELRDQGYSLREIGLEIGRKTQSIRSCLSRQRGARS